MPSSHLTQVARELGRQRQAMATTSFRHSVANRTADGWLKGRQKASAGEYRPHTSRRVADTSPVVARAASAAFIGKRTLSEPSAALRRADRAPDTAAASRSRR